MVAQPQPLIDRGLYMYNYTYFHYIPLNIPLNPNKSLYFHIYICFHHIVPYLGQLGQLKLHFPRRVTSTTLPRPPPPRTWAMQRPRCWECNRAWWLMCFFFVGWLYVVRLYTNYTNYIPIICWERKRPTGLLDSYVHSWGCGLTCFNNLTWGYNGYIVHNEWWLDTTSLWVINNNIPIIAMLKFQNNNRWLPNNIPIIIYQ